MTENSAELNNNNQQFDISRLFAIKSPALRSMKTYTEDTVI